MNPDLPVAVVVPVYRNGPCLAELTRRLTESMDVPWRLRFVVDACPEGGLEDALAVAASDNRVAVTYLLQNAGQHAALVHGLVDEPVARAWVVMDGDLQDPPEAVGELIRHLESSTASGVFAGRRGEYEACGRRVTGTLHRRLLSSVTGLPRDAGAFLALDAHLRCGVIDAVRRRGAPSVVVAAGASGVPLISVPVQRSPRHVGTSAWTHTARVRQSVRTLLWAAQERTTAHRLVRPAH